MKWSKMLVLVLVLGGLVAALGVACGGGTEVITKIETVVVEKPVTSVETVIETVVVEKPVTRVETVIETVVVEKPVTSIERVIETVVVERTIAGETVQVIETVVVEREVTRVEKVVETVVVEKQVTQVEKVVETVVVEKRVTQVEKVVETVVVEQMGPMVRLDCSDEDPCWPEVIKDSIPAQFNEAPMLAERVAAGELPPLEERLPDRPMVIKPSDGIGVYGGTMRKGFPGPNDFWQIGRLMSDSPLTWDAAQTKVEPQHIERWEHSDDLTEYTLYLRKGIRWSDGELLTVDDYMFAYEDIFLNSELGAGYGTQTLLVGGEIGVHEKIDDYTLKITFAEPYGIFLERYASIGAGLLGYGSTGPSAYAPRHYMEQFHPNYIGEDEANELAEDAGFENWVTYFKNRIWAWTNPEVPTLTPWVVKTPNTSTTIIMERNPYYFAVDPEGNQLPYIDRVEMTLVEDLEVLNLRAIAGEYDYQSRHIQTSKLPVHVQNAEKGGYRILLNSTPNTSPASIWFNIDYDADPEIAEYTAKSKEFRQALSMSIERDQINEAFFLGLGVGSSQCPQFGSAPYLQTDFYDNEYGTLRAERANEILDSIGLDQKDSEGFRLMPGGRRIVVRLDTWAGGVGGKMPDIMEMVADHWETNVGVKTEVNPVERSLLRTRGLANENMTYVHSLGLAKPFLEGEIRLTGRWAPKAGDWLLDPSSVPGYEPPDWVKQIIDLQQQGLQTTGQDRIDFGRQIIELQCDQMFDIATVTGLKSITLVNNDLLNISYPLYGSVYALTPSNGFPPTWSFGIQP